MKTDFVAVDAARCAELDKCEDWTLNGQYKTKTDNSGSSTLYMTLDANSPKALNRNKQGVVAGFSVAIPANKDKSLQEMYVAGYYRVNPSDAKPMKINLGFDNTNSLDQFLEKPEELFSDRSAFTAATYWQYSSTGIKNKGKTLRVKAKRSYESILDE